MLAGEFVKVLELFPGRQYCLDEDDLDGNAVVALKAHAEELQEHRTVVDGKIFVGITVFKQLPAQTVLFPKRKAKCPTFICACSKEWVPVQQRVNRFVLAVVMFVSVKTLTFKKFSARAKFLLEML